MFGHQIRAGQENVSRPKINNLNIGPTRFNKQRSTVVGDLQGGRLRDVEEYDDDPVFSTLEEEGKLFYVFLNMTDFLVLYGRWGVMGGLNYNMFFQTN